MTIVIRRAERHDAEGLRDLYKGEKAYSGTLQLPYPSLERWATRVENTGDSHYHLVAEQDGKVVGNAGLMLETHPRRRHVVNLGMAVHDDHQGAGIGTQLLLAAIELADNWLGVTRMELSVYTDNTAALALYEKHGFMIEGTAKHYAFRNGTYVDVYHMARLRDSLSG